MKSTTRYFMDYSNILLQHSCTVPFMLYLPSLFRTVSSYLIYVETELKSFFGWMRGTGYLVRNKDFDSRIALLYSTWAGDTPLSGRRHHFVRIITARVLLWLAGCIGRRHISGPKENCQFVLT
jgi:hypothetical protein